MQFQDYLANECKNPELFNCASCKGKLRKCLHGFYGQKRVKIESFLRDADGKREHRWVSGFDDICRYIDDVKKELPQINEIEAVLLGQGHGICPIPLFNELTIELLNMIDICGKINPTNYYDQPALYIQALSIVNAERGRLMKLRTKSG